MEDIEFTLENDNSNNVLVFPPSPSPSPSPNRRPSVGCISDPALARAARLTVWRDGCVDNVPRMRVHGLKLIGRCVILHMLDSKDGARPAYYYTGLVTMVTSLTISMMHVNRYTEADFAKYKERERHIMIAKGMQRYNHFFNSAHFMSDAGGFVSACELSGDILQHPPPQSCGGDAVLLEGEADVCEIDSARGLSAAFPLQPQAEVREHGRRNSALTTGATNAAQPQPTSPNRASTSSSKQEIDLLDASSDSSQKSIHFSVETSHGVSVGPLPYVTVNRKNIRSAFLGRDPRSSFFSLFQNRYKELVDMQYLRMLVRQYLVHVSEGNKARRVPLYAFVTTRAACPMVDAELLERLAFEEITTLLNADVHGRGNGGYVGGYRYVQRLPVEEIVVRSNPPSPSSDWDTVPAVRPTADEQIILATPRAAKTSCRCCCCQ